MNNTISGRRSLFRVGMAAALGLLAVAAVVPSPAAAKGGYGSRSLVGTWRVTVTTFPCANPQARNPAFVSLLTFGEDGTLIETTSSPQFQPGQRSTGHGRWERTGPGAFRAVSEAYIQFATNPAPPPPAPTLLRGRQRIDQGIQMTSRDSFESDASVFFFNSPSDTSGTTYFSGCAEASGVRFE